MIFSYENRVTILDTQKYRISGWRTISKGCSHLKSLTRYHKIQIAFPAWTKSAHRLDRCRSASVRFSVLPMSRVRCSVSIRRPYPPSWVEVNQILQRSKLCAEEVVAFLQSIYGDAISVFHHRNMFVGLRETSKQLRIWIHQCHIRNNVQTTPSPFPTYRISKTLVGNSVSYSSYRARQYNFLVGFQHWKSKSIALWHPTNHKSSRGCNRVQMICGFWSIPINVKPRFVRQRSTPFAAERCSRLFVGERPDYCCRSKASGRILVTIRRRTVLHFSSVLGGGFCEWKRWIINRLYGPPCDGRTVDWPRNRMPVYNLVGGHGSKLLRDQSTTLPQTALNHNGSIALCKFQQFTKISLFDQGPDQELTCCLDQLSILESFFEVKDHLSSCDSLRTQKQ